MNAQNEIRLPEITWHTITLGCLSARDVVDQATPAQDGFRAHRACGDVVAFLHASTPWHSDALLIATALSKPRQHTMTFECITINSFRERDCVPSKCRPTACPSAAAEGALHRNAVKSLRSCAPKAVGCMGMLDGHLALFCIREP
jgi:hypothetical protein